MRKHFLMRAEHELGTLMATQIAGAKSDEDWRRRKDELNRDSSEKLWRRTFCEFFVERLETRYLSPIDVLQKTGAKNGEGFAIVALQCSLIEFLAATREGLKYVFGKADPKKHEYSGSKKLFLDFLTTAAPFKRDFTHADHATHFYEGVRCGLLHEARTKKGWKIRMASAEGPSFDFDKKIVYRDRLQGVFRQYVETYGNELITCKCRQEAFIRKFDDLCHD